ncbi:hypothetical protein ACMD2_18645 [Ananas comosus]|uniref:Methyltransferase type 11 domain-containing protein n=1 Tax=Ananas comosus TaxID=4615 RepID=A0A199UPN3_ANACO|nr:hypothetical protein ACMD2_18645 [Ananas comosus]
MTRSNFRALQSRLAASDALLEKLLVAHVDQSVHDTWQVEPTRWAPTSCPSGTARTSMRMRCTWCSGFEKDLERYMSYEVGGACPSDAVFAQKLMLKGCEPLPRRRCRPKSPIGFAEPDPLPDSLWRVPPRYKHRRRWLADNGGLNFGIDSVLKLKPRGTIRIGLDIGGGTGTFAARMRERGVTVVTTTMDFDRPFNNFVASRGLVPLHVSVAHRLPFYDGTLDVVHTMHVLSNWVPDTVLEFALFGIYRVLWPRGLFWLDHFFCVGSQLDSIYVPMLDRVGFRKLRWTTGRKLDRGIEMNQWYLSTVLEKPIT